MLILLTTIKEYVDAKIEKETQRNLSSKRLENAEKKLNELGKYYEEVLQDFGDNLKKIGDKNGK